MGTSDSYQNHELHSSQIPVKHFEMTFVWPVRIQAVRQPDGSFDNANLDPNRPDNDFLSHWSDEVTRDKRWESVDHQYPGDWGPSYAEYCYFHPFVRNFLYTSREDIRQHEKRVREGTSTSKDPINRNLRIFRRADIESGKATVEVEYEVDKRAEKTAFELKNCWLYLFDTTVAILEVNLIYKAEPQSTQSIPLSSAMAIQNVARRVYAPFWDSFSQENDDSTEGKTGIFSHTPLSLKMNLPGQTKPVEAFFGRDSVEHSSIDKKVATKNQEWQENLEKQIQQAVTSKAYHRNHSTPDMAIAAQVDHINQHREPHTHAVLRELLLPIEPVNTETLPHAVNQNRAALQFEHIQDDRIPLMSFLGVGNSATPQALGVRAITEYDWARLSNLDGPDDSFSPPYSSAFLDSDAGLSQYTYDRFWYAGPAHGEQFDTGQNWLSTRWLISDVSFTAVGNGDDKGFFMHEQSGALSHFRRHYFAMFMIAIYHRASLLSYKHRLAEIADALLEKQSEPKKESNFKRDIERLQKEFFEPTPIHLANDVD